jgi:hypothetical protein
MTERTWSPSSNDATDPSATIVLAQADAPAAEEATALPRNLVDVEEALGEPQAAAGGEIDVVPLATGERRVIDVPPGALVNLDDPAFDPAVATYVVSGNDLLVTLANGGVLVLTGFFAPSEAPPQLSVLGGEPALPGQLLARAEEVPDVDQPPDVEPAPGLEPGPEPGPGEPVSGGAPFRAYDQGNIGDGLDPLGPLGPTALGFGLPAPELADSSFDGLGADGRGDEPPPPPPPETLPPEVTLRAPFEATIGEESGPAFNPVTTPVLPVLGTGQAIPEDDINGVDQRNLTLDIEREVFVRFIDEESFSIDSLFVHEIGPNGEIQNIRLVFDGVNKPGDPLSELKETTPGTEFSLGSYEAGTELGFVLLNNGLRVNDFSQFEGGRFEFRNVLTGEPSTIFDFHNLEQSWRQPRLFHIADDGTETQLIGERFFTADASQDSPGDNRLNPTGQGAFVSGWDDEEGLLVLGVEDSIRPQDTRDFTGLTFGVRFGSPTEKVLVIDGGGGLGATITDPDSTEMASATITLTGFAGDRLVLDPASGADKGITVSQVSDTEIRLEGLSSIENYEAVINATTIAVDLENPTLGSRDISVTVLDPDGNPGTSTTSFTVDDDLLVGDGDGDGPGNGDVPGDGDDDNGDGDGNGSGDDGDIGSGDDVIIGTSSSEPGKTGNDVISGRAGDDEIIAVSGDDFVDGGDGKDFIDVRGPGNNIVIGGPQPDLINLGPWPDVVRITGLGDGADTIRNFNATEGDKLDLTQLFRDSDINAASFDHFVRTSAITNGVKVQVDLDGAGAEQRFVDVAYLVNPVGVTSATDPATFVITPDNDPTVT